MAKSSGEQGWRDVYDPGEVPPQTLPLPPVAPKSTGTDRS